MAYMVEGNASSTGSVIDWSCKFAKIDNPQELVDLASTVEGENLMSELR